MNATKTILRAVSLHVNPRKAMRYVIRLESTAKVRGDMAALRATVESEVAPILAAMRQADALLDNCAKGRPVTGTNETSDGSLAKYDVVYGMGRMVSDMHAQG